MAQPSAEFNRVVALLGFDDWTPADKVIEALTFTIKPLRALERYQRVFADGEAKRAAARRQKIAEGTFNAVKSNPGSRKLESREAQIRAGARDILNDTIQNTRNAGLVEMKVVEGERLLRRRERRERDATRFLVCCHHGLPCQESVNETEREEVPPMV